MSAFGSAARSPLHFTRRGTGNRLLLVHGLGSSVHNWEPVMPTLSAQREVIAIDLPGFGRSAPLAGPVTIGTLTDSVEAFIADEGLGDVDAVGSSMGARMVLEMARRGYAGNVVSLAPGGFWNDRQRRIFGASLKASVALVRGVQPILPLLVGSPVSRTALMAQFSARPWKLSPDLVLTELRGFKTSSSPSLDEALSALVDGPLQEGAPAGTLEARVAIGWGRQDKVTLPSEATRAMELFPDAELHWFDSCGHFPHWDQPAQTARFILDSTEPK